VNNTGEAIRLCRSERLAAAISDRLQTSKIPARLPIACAAPGFLRGTQARSAAGLPLIFGYLSAMAKSGARDWWLTLIAVSKLLKGLLLLGAALGFLRLLNGDLHANLQKTIEYLSVDPNNHFFKKIFSKLTTMSPNRIKVLGLGTFFYSLLFLTEGVGLLFQKRWAEFFTIFVTGSFIPLEIYELVKKFEAIKVLVLISNAAIVVYLIWKVGHSKKQPRSKPAAHR
jgi:uncharacterized membrane protein (DUF2068 family)